METDQFTVVAKSERMDIKMVATVRSTEACMGSSITCQKNKIFDMLRGMEFDADKIDVDKYTQQGEENVDD